MDTCDQVEIPSYACTPVFIHASIPAGTSLGHRADSWGVDKPDYTCRLTALSKGDTFIVRLWLLGATKDDDELFAECFWHPDRPLVSIVDPAADSSRYFALKIENPDTKSHTFVGLGFANRDDAGNFKEALHQHGLYLQRMQQAAVRARVTAERVESREPDVDMSLGRESVRVKLPGSHRPGGFLATQRAGLVVPIALSPGAPAVAVVSSGAAAPAGAAPVEYDDDDFGEFTG